MVFPRFTRPHPSQLVHFVDLVHPQYVQALSILHQGELVDDTIDFVGKAKGMAPPKWGTLIVFRRGNVSRFKCQLHRELLPPQAKAASLAKPNEVVEASDSERRVLTPKSVGVSQYRGWFPLGFGVLRHPRA